MEPGEEPRSKQCNSDIIEGITTPVRDYLKGVPSEFAALLRSQYTEYVRFYSVVLALANRHNFASESQSSSVLMCYTIMRYRKTPVAVLQDIAVNYWHLISNYTFIDKNARSRLSAFLQSNPPPLIPTFPLAPHELAMHRAAISEVGATASGDTLFDTSLPPKLDPWPARPLVLILGLKFVQLSASAISLLLAVTLLPALLGVIRDRDLILLGVISLVIQLNFLIVAVADVAQPRYVFPVWPGLWLVLIWTFLKLVRSRSPSKQSWTT